MSEYQWYEFVALDRPLSPKDMQELRAISSRAEITRTRFSNEYEWGDLKADPAALLVRYFDAHLYFANWGTHRFMLRLPAANVDEQSLRAYFPGGAVTLTRAGSHVILDFSSDTDEPEDESRDPVSLGALTPLRASLLEGDLTPAYVAWLLALQSGDVKQSAREPLVPAGIAVPSAPLAALIDFLRIDPDLLRAAAEASDRDNIAPAELRRWLSSLGAHEKDAWLLRASTQPVHGDLLAAFRKHRGKATRGSRTVGQLRARAEEHRAAREREEAARHKQARAASEAARRKHLARSAKQGDRAWHQLDRLVDDRRYEDAVRLTIDLWDLARDAGRLVDFEGRLHALKKQHPRRRGYLDAVKRTLSAPDGADD